SRLSVGATERGRDKRGGVKMFLSITGSNSARPESVRDWPIVPDSAIVPICLGFIFCAGHLADIISDHARICRAAWSSTEMAKPIRLGDWGCLWRSPPQSKSMILRKLDRL